MLRRNCGDFLLDSHPRMKWESVVLRKLSAMPYADRSCDELASEFFDSLVTRIDGSATERKGKG